MNNSSENPISPTLLSLPYLLNIYFGGFIWIFGNIGAIGNLIVYSSQKFRKQSISIYLLATSICYLHYFNFVLMTRMIQQGYGKPMMNAYTIICKIRQFSTIWGNIVPLNLFFLATLDCLLSTHRSFKYRRWSNNRPLSIKLSIFCPLFWLVLIVHRIVLYRIVNGSCGPPPGFYALYDNYFQVVISSYSPVVIMAVLAYFLIRNIRLVKQRRIYPETPNQVTRTSTQRTNINIIDIRLTIGLFLQCIIAFVTYFPYGSQLTYVSITGNWVKSPLRKAWESVFTEVIHLMSYVFFASTFYVSFGTNVGFRKVLKGYLKKITRTNNHQPNLNTTQINATTIR